MAVKFDWLGLRSKNKGGKQLKKVRKSVKKLKVRVRLLRMVGWWVWMISVGCFDLLDYNQQ